MGIIAVLAIVLLLVSVAAKKPKTYTPVNPRNFQIYTPIIPSPSYTPVERPRHKCVFCNGRGLVKCSLCNGRGGRYNPHDPIDHWSECVFCDGTGLVTCSLCNGMGYW